MDKVSDDPKRRLKIQSSKRKTGFPSKESGLFYSKLRNSFSRLGGRSGAMRLARLRASTNRSDVTLPCLNVLRY